MTNNKRPRKRSEGYVERSPAICVVVHDPNGKPMADSDVTEILHRVTEVAVDKGYIINFTRT